MCFHQLRNCTVCVDELQCDVLSIHPNEHSRSKHPSGLLRCKHDDDQINLVHNFFSSYLFSKLVLAAFFAYNICDLSHSCVRCDLECRIKFYHLFTFVGTHRFKQSCYHSSALNATAFSVYTASFVQLSILNRVQCFRSAICGRDLHDEQPEPNHQ